MSDPFAEFTSDDVRTLVTHFPLAWVCSEEQASQLPLIGEYDDAGRLVALIGHLARANALHARLSTTHRALVLFSGPDAYVSPEHAGKVDWAPTWLYANLRVSCEVTVDAELTDYSLDLLIAAMERGRVAPWNRAAIAHRYDRMAGSIIGFRARVVTVEGRFKFGQDESDAVYRTILDRLPDAEVTDWMRRFARGRPES